MLLVFRKVVITQLHKHFPIQSPNFTQLRVLLLSATDAEAQTTSCRPSDHVLHQEPAQGIVDVGGVTRPRYVMSALPVAYALAAMA